MVAARSASPDLNPLSLYIKEQEDEAGAAGLDSNEKVPFDLDAGDGLLPNQNPSIIGESATVRYYQGSTKRPIIVSSGLQGQAKTVEEIEEPSSGGHDSAHFDVQLSLDVTTGCGGKIWPAAEVLGQYIASTRSTGQWDGKTVVELGAGTGLVGLLAARATQLSEVWITDQIPMMALMQTNLDLNKDLSSRCFVAELNWGEATIPEGVPPLPDVLLLADCVYLEVAFQPLVDTMKAMTTRETEILFCYQQRRKADKRFFKLLRKHFSFQDIADDDPIRSMEYNRQGTRLYRVHKIKD